MKRKVCLLRSQYRSNRRISQPSPYRVVPTTSVRGLEFFQPRSET